MTTIQLPEPRVWESIVINKISASHLVLRLSQDEIHFWRGSPLAVVTGGVLYFSTPLEPAETKMVNETSPDAPHVRSAAGDFDFLVGQLFTKAGLPLTRREG